MAGCLAAFGTLLGTFWVLLEASGALLGASGSLLGASGSLLRTCRTTGALVRIAGVLRRFVLKDNIEREADFEEVGCRQLVQRPGGRRPVGAPNL